MWAQIWQKDLQQHSDFHNYNQAVYCIIAQNVNVISCHIYVLLTISALLNIRFNDIVYNKKSKAFYWVVDSL